MSRIPPIPESELEFSFVRSSGPGGQNVNKVNSKAVLRWSVSGSQALTEEQRSLLLQKLPVTVSGDLVITSDRHRDQPANKEACQHRLRELIENALKKPKARRKTQPSRSSRLKRKESKKRHSDKKAARRFKGRY
jgi:ribosome-associated protein